MFIQFFSFMNKTASVISGLKFRKIDFEYLPCSDGDSPARTARPAVLSMLTLAGLTHISFLDANSEACALFNSNPLNIMYVIGHSESVLCLADTRPARRKCGQVHRQEQPADAGVADRRIVRHARAVSALVQ